MNMRKLVLEHNVKNEDGTIHFCNAVIISPASDWGEVWEDLMRGIPDEFKNTDEYCEGRCPSCKAVVYYDQTFLRTSKTDEEIFAEYT